MSVLRLGTRGSLLALAQSKRVKATLEANGQAVELEVISTVGDRQTEQPIHELSGQGLFTRELDDALLTGRVRLAVHSLKDLPTALPDGLCLAAVPMRVDPRDVLAGPAGKRTTLATLAQVHKSVLNPAATGPAFSIATSSCFWSGDNLGVGPGCGLAARAAMPPSCHARFQRFTLERLAPTWRTISARGFRSLKSFAARRRRASSSVALPLVLIQLHTVLAHYLVHDREALPIFGTSPRHTPPRHPASARFQ